MGTSAARKALSAPRGPTCSSPPGSGAVSAPHLPSPSSACLCFSPGLLTLPPTHLNKAFRFSGSSVRPAYPGFMVIKMPMVGMRLIISPRKLNVFFLARMASWTHFT